MVRAIYGTLWRFAASIQVEASIEHKPAQLVKRPNMIKIATLSLISALALTAASAFAGEKACCANKSGKMECSQIYAKLNLTPEQKTKLDAFQATCEKGGCTEESMEKFFQEAKGVLSSEQYTQLKSECGKMQEHSAKAGS